jgi:aminoglycoside phosphotransferase (APT) family kinase protein
VAFDEPLDIENESSLLRYLLATQRIGGHESPRMRVLAGGVSNKTVLVERPSGESWVLKQALPKLRTKADWFSDPSRIRREAEALRWLPKFAPPGTITPLVFEDPEHFVLAMEAVPQPHENWKEMLLAGRVEMDHVEQFARILGSIHRRAAEAGDEVRRAFADRSFFESLRVEPYYQYTASQVPEASGFLHDLIDDTRSRQLTIVHGDFSPKNILVYDGRLVLLDHEVIHWGDPAFDFGFALTHLLSKAGHLPQFRREFGKAASAFLVDYNAARGLPAGNPDDERRFVRHALGCLLARVAGRSPLEYLSDDERDQQRRVVVALMRTPPTGVIDLAVDFTSSLDRADADARD